MIPIKINFESSISVRELHKEFALCGADVLEAFTFNGTDDNLNTNKPADKQLSVRIFFTITFWTAVFTPIKIENKVSNYINK